MGELHPRRIRTRRGGGGEGQGEVMALSQAKAGKQLSDISACSHVFLSLFFFLTLENSRKLSGSFI